MQTFDGEFFNGDCLEVLKNVPDCSVDLVVTSPPYDNLRTYNDSLEWSFDVFKDIAKELSRVIKDGGVIVWNVADATIKGSETCISFKQAIFFKEECGLNLRDTMIWNKPNPMPTGDSSYYQNSFEYMFVLTKGKPKTVNVLREAAITAGSTKQKTITQKHGWNPTGETYIASDTKRRKNVWSIPTNSEKTGHPAVFPVQLAKDHILSWTNEGDVVLDPFGGSGTTAIAARETNRKWVLIEKNEDYFNKACARINSRVILDV